MVAILAAPDVRTEWDGFRDCLLGAYSKNADRTLQIAAWFDDLHSRRVGENIELTRSRFETERRATSTVGLSSRRAFAGFCINDQMCFSADPAVLTWPYANALATFAWPDAHSMRANPPIKRVGVWLHDYGPLDRDAGHLIAGTLERLPSDQQTRFYRPDFPASIREISDLLTRHLKEPSLPPYGVDFPKDHWQLRIARNKPTGSTPHADHIDIDSAIWERALLVSIMGNGTAYCVGEYNMKVQSPPGSTACHIANYDGVKHAAVGNSDGRVVLICGSAREVRVGTDLWRQKKLAACIS